MREFIHHVSRTLNTTEALIIEYIVELDNYLKGQPFLETLNTNLHHFGVCGWSSELQYIHVDVILFFVCNKRTIRCFTTLHFFHIYINLL